MDGNMDSTRSTARVKEESSRRRNTNIMIGICMWTALGLAGILAGSNSTDAVGTARKNIGAIIVLMCLASVALTSFMLLRFIRNSERFHKTQVVFWPSRCRHCAEILRVTKISSAVNDDKTDDDEHLHSENYDTESASSNLSSDDDSQNISRNNCAPSMEENSSENQPIVRTPDGATSSSACINTSINRETHFSSLHSHTHATNRAEVNVFIVFTCICCVGILNGIIRVFVHYSQGRKLVAEVSFETIFDFIFFLFLPVLIVFIDRYHDARFIHTLQNHSTLTMVLALSIWMVIFQFSRQLDVLIDEKDDCNHSTRYASKTTYHHFQHEVHRITIPFYMEASVMILAISIQIWKSFIPKPSLQVENYPLVQVSERSRIVNLLRRLVSKMRQGCRGDSIPLRFGSTDDRPLPHWMHHHWRVLRFIRVTWSLTLLVNALFLAVSMFLMFRGDYFDSKNQDAYVRWCVEIAAYLIFFLLCARQSWIARKITQHSEVLDFHTKGPETVLLVASGGAFCLYLLRIITAIALLSKYSILDKTEIDLCAIGIINSLVTITAVWQITSFLLSMPMKSVKNTREMKWVLLCLINIIILCGSWWFVMIIDETFMIPHIEILYFGPRFAHIISSMLEPFLSLYKIHAAMTAYEIYKEVVQMLS